ncbi:MAG: endonuclease/exonuclease/phosphatase family protein [Oligoflexia bacterium]|nr:endonuclease/exonuclease/phosphatase family protein [Oligoflexia bacterium]
MIAIVWRLVVFVPALTSLLNFLPIPPYWFEELNRFWSIYYLLHHLLALLLLVLSRRRISAGLQRWGVALFVMLSLGYAREFWPFILASRPTPESVFGEEPGEIRTFKLAHVSWEPAADRVGLLSWLSVEKPDLVAISGLNAELESALMETNYFSYHEALPRADGFGLGVFSRFAIRSLEQTSVGEDLPPVLATTIGLPAQQASTVPLALVLYKGLPPWAEHDYHLNRLVVRRFSTQYRHGHSQLIVVGNLGAPHSSYSYMRLKKAGSFRDAMQGFGLLRTWDARRPWLRFTLDHVLYRGHMLVSDFRTYEVPGLSHKGLVVKFVYQQAMQGG